MVNRIILACMGVLPLFACAQITQGVAYYKVTYPSLKADMRKYAHVLPVAMQFTFRHHEFMSEVRTAASYSKTIGDARSRDLTILAEIKDKKIMVRRSGYNYEEAKPRVFVTLTSDTKKIAGFTCKKAEVVLLDLDNRTSTNTIWYCDSIGSSWHGYEPLYPEIKGLLMEYTVQQGGIEMVYTVTYVEAKPIDKSAFTIPAAGYTLMSDREFMHLMNK